MLILPPPVDLLIVFCRDQVDARCRPRRAGVLGNQTRLLFFPSDPETPRHSPLDRESVRNPPLGMGSPSEGVECMQTTGMQTTECRRDMF